MTVKRQLAIMIKHYLLLIGFAMMGNLNAQNYEKIFLKHVENQDTMGQRLVLAEWVSQFPLNPSFYTCCYDYQMRVGRIDSLPRPRKSEPLLWIIDDSTAILPEAYETITGKYNAYRVTRAFNCLDIGIADNPQRFDMRVLKANTMIQLGEYFRVNDLLCDALEHGLQTDFAWTNHAGKPIKKPIDYTIREVRAFTQELLRRQDTVTSEQLTRCALKYFPKNTALNADLARITMANKEYKFTIKFLSDNLQENPSQPELIELLADCYHHTGNRENAVRFYQKVLKEGNKTQKAHANKRLQELR
jgi:tetratricopeptide (TPR) repeat protein